MKPISSLFAVSAFLCLLVIPSAPLQASPKETPDCEETLSLRDFGLSSSVAILTVLASGPNYALGIIEELKRRNVVIPQGSIFSTLPLLVDRKLIVALSNEEVAGLGLSTSAAGIRGGRPRIYYKLTETGEELSTRYRENIMFFFGIQTSK